MTTPNGRDARTGENLDATDPSVGGDAAVGGAARPEPTPRTPDRDSAVSDLAPRTDQPDTPDGDKDPGEDAAAG
ncbi:hypothetical protein [Blastococcus sp. Marseille-P5729]|uniref:hypothetical protein n=1 Tax=Blastococcus sp. Marseille-P5729 TaxID=2086582 RepID=UPI000D112974|nr:hypothetical protein [Blastococcus sp. Marseille-P5729]